MSPRSSCEKRNETKKDGELGLAHHLFLIGYPMKAFPLFIVANNGEEDFKGWWGGDIRCRCEISTVGGRDIAL